ncbi:Uncharacterised protein [Mycobacteroides abscessus subsp. abscessus]|uniref:hypothetical protein n=1 Tax=Mycobacteroides abscessus TaxID=36809 RepID=UPI000925FAD2|nr:hypothetical protein [Mycobacteroides abscessus]SIH20594.1 Uncharacterised protein [Mycobacteroides abscessus subsp. abscessus]
MSNKIIVEQVGFDNEEGLITWAITEHWDVIDRWLTENNKTVEVIRGHQIDAAGRHTFQSGGGYDVIAADLLGGELDGTTSKQFTDDTGFHFFLQ